LTTLAPEQALRVAQTFVVCFARRVGVSGSSALAGSLLPQGVSEVVARLLSFAGPVRGPDMVAAAWMDTADAQQQGILLSMPRPPTPPNDEARRAEPPRVEVVSPSPDRPPVPPSPHRLDHSRAAPFPSLSASVTSPEVAALLARDEERLLATAEIWSSHQIPSRLGVDIFSPAQRARLADLPEMALRRDEAEFGETRLAVRAVADAAAVLAGLPTAGVEQHLASLLRRGSGREEAALSPSSFLAVQANIALLDSPMRPRALFDLSLLAVRLSPAYRTPAAAARLDRLIVASLTVHPGSAKQARAWSTKSAPSATGLAELELVLASPSPLAVRSAGAQLF
jgi:hypothetical protein